MEENQIEQFCLKMYIQALHKSQQNQFNEDKYKEQIQIQFKQSKIPFFKLKPHVVSTKNEWIQDLLQITRDIKLANKTSSLYLKKFKDRAKMHFSNDHKQNLSKLLVKSQATKNVISMYTKTQTKQFNLHQINKFSDFILNNSVYLIGLIKANGVLIENNVIITCAHAFQNNNNKFMKFRCFITGTGSYGVIKVQKNGLFCKQDVGIAKIIYNTQNNIKKQPLHLFIPKILKFKKQFNQIRCIQVGLLFNNEPQSSFINVFETAQGFIEKNLYEDEQDNKLNNEMGLLVHDCYGLWGTSGSPLWNSTGQLLGIHNAWNENKYNVSMIVHDDDSIDCRAVRQYQRRVISVHVLANLYNNWKKLECQHAFKYKSQIQQINGIHCKKKVKL